MTTLKTLLAISAVTVALAAPAAAQWVVTPSLPNGSLLMIDSSGKATVREAGKMAHSMMVRHGKRVGAGVILFMDGGQLYSMADRRMTNGRMLSEILLEQRLGGSTF